MTRLRLVENCVVVQFPEPSTFEQAWEARKGMMRKRGDGREKTRKIWDRAAKTVGSARLLEALKRYLREEKEPTCGYPGLSVWLNGERWDHWLVDPRQGDQSPDGPSTRKGFSEPYRGAVLLALGEPFVISYLDQCTLAEDGALVIPRGKRTLYERLKEKARELDAAGLTKRRWGDVL